MSAIHDIARQIIAAAHKTSEAFPEMFAIEDRDVQALAEDFHTQQLWLHPAKHKSVCQIEKDIRSRSATIMGVPIMVLLPVPHE